MSESTFSDISPHDIPVRAAMYGEQRLTNPKSHNRSIAMINAGLRTLDDLEVVEPDIYSSFDEMLSRRMQRVFDSGRRDFVFFDLGSGDGGIFFDFLSAKNTVSSSRDFLRQHPDFHLTMIGLTDAPNAKNHNQQKQLTVDEKNLSEEEMKINSRVEVKNIYWSLAATQNLEGFLSTNGVTGLDLVFATESMRYLSARQFKTSLETITQYLNKGGTFVCQGFAGSEPGIVYPSASGRTEFPKTSQSEKDQTLWKKLFKSFTEDTSLVEIERFIMENPGLTVEEIERARDRAMQVYLKSGAIDRDSIQIALTEIRRRYKYTIADEKTKAVMEAAWLLNYGFKHFHQKRERENYFRKCAIVNGLRNNGYYPLYFKGISGNDRNPKGFVIGKN